MNWCHPRKWVENKIWTRDEYTPRVCSTDDYDNGRCMHIILYKSNKWNSRKHFYCAISRQNVLSTNNRVPFEIFFLFIPSWNFMRYAHLVCPIEGIRISKMLRKIRTCSGRGKGNKINSYSNSNENNTSSSSSSSTTATWKTERNRAVTRVSQSILCIHFTTIQKSHPELLNYSHGDSHHHLKRNISSLWRERERESGRAACRERGCTSRDREAKIMNVSV